MLLWQIGDNRLHLFLDLADCRFLVLHLTGLFFHFAVVFEELVEQHRVHCLVAHGFGPPVRIAEHQVGAYFLPSFKILAPSVKAEIWSNDEKECPIATGTLARRMRYSNVACESVMAACYSPALTAAGGPLRGMERRFGPLPRRSAAKAGEPPLSLRSRYELFIRDRSRCCLVQFHLGAHLLDLRGLLFELGRENLYLFPLLRDRCLQLLNFEIEHGLLRALRNVGPGGGLGRKSTRVGSIDGERAQPSIGIDEHDSCRPGGNRRTEDVVDKAPVTYLAKNTVNTRVAADDDVVIDGGETSAGFAADADVVGTRLVVPERSPTECFIVVTGCVEPARGGTYRGVAAAVDI